MNLLGKHEGRRPLSRYSRRWEATIKLDLTEMLWLGVRTLNCTGSDKDKLGGGMFRKNAKHAAAIKRGECFDQLSNF